MNNEQTARTSGQATSLAFHRPRRSDPFGLSWIPTDYSMARAARAQAPAAAAPRPANHADAWGQGSGAPSVQRETGPSNQLLASLPPEVAEALRSRIVSVDLAAGTVLHETGTILRHVYFPVTAVISLVSPLQGGACAEVAVVGREGVVGVCAFMGGGNALSNAVVQRAGSAWRMNALDIADLSRTHPALMQRLLRYTQAMLTHMALTSACYRHHALAQQLCRWLLQHLDRQGDMDLWITHERIAGMLGVRREGVTGAAQQLQRQGLILCSRGHIRLLDRPRLEQHTCECYRVVERAYDELRQCESHSPHPLAAAPRVSSNEDAQMFSQRWGTATVHATPAAA